MSQHSYDCMTQKIRDYLDIHGDKVLDDDVVCDLQWQGFDACTRDVVEARAYREEHGQFPPPDRVLSEMREVAEAIGGPDLLFEAILAAKRAFAICGSFESALCAANALCGESPDLKPRPLPLPPESRPVNLAVYNDEV